MLQEAINAIRELAADAARAAEPRIAPIPGDPRHYYVDATGTGGWEKESLPRAPFCHAVETVEDMTRLALYAKQELGLRPAVWHFHSGIKLVFDRGEPWDVAIVNLPFDPRWKTLRALESARPLRQRELLTLLRVDLAGCLATPRLVNAVAHVNFRAAAMGESIIQQGRETLGRHVENEVAGVKEPIPEREIVRVPLYANVGERELKWDVECDLEVNAAEQVFVFRPLPGEMEAAIALHQADIRQRLIEALGEEVEVYAGVP